MLCRSFFRHFLSSVVPFFRHFSKALSFPFFGIFFSSIVPFFRNFLSFVAPFFCRKELKEKYDGRLEKHVSGQTYEVLGRVLKGLVNRKITVPGAFKGTAGSSLSCSYKAGEFIVLLQVDSVFMGRFFSLGGFFHWQDSIGRFFLYCYCIFLRVNFILFFMRLIWNRLLLRTYFIFFITRAVISFSIRFFRVNTYRICRNKRPPRKKRRPKTVIFQRGGVHKTDGFWWVMFSKGGVHKTDRFWWVMFSKGGVHETDGILMDFGMSSYCF